MKNKSGEKFKLASLEELLGLPGEESSSEVEISKIHGLSLSAWAIAGLTGNNMSELILSLSNKNYDYILIATLIFYIIAMVICMTMVKPSKKAEEK